MENENAGRKARHKEMGNRGIPQIRLHVVRAGNQKKRLLKNRKQHHQHHGISNYGYPEVEGRVQWGQ